MHTTYTKPRPYTHHTEREARYEQELREIKRRGGTSKDIEGMEAQALQNACSSEFIDATMHLSEKRISIAYKDRIFSTEYIVLKVVKLGDIRSNERACFGIVHLNSLQQEETLPIFPSTKISILEKEQIVHESAMHFF